MRAARQRRSGHPERPRPHRRSAAGRCRRSAARPSARTCCSATGGIVLQLAAPDRSCDRRSPTLAAPAARPSDLRERLRSAGCECATRSPRSDLHRRATPFHVPRRCRRRRKRRSVCVRAAGDDRCRCRARSMRTSRVGSPGITGKRCRAAVALPVANQQRARRQRRITLCSEKPPWRFEGLRLTEIRDRRHAAGDFHRSIHVNEAI